MNKLDPSLNPSDSQTGFDHNPGGLIKALQEMDIESITNPNKSPQDYLQETKHNPAKAVVITSAISTVSVSSFDVFGDDVGITETFNMHLDESTGYLNISDKKGIVLIRIFVRDPADAKYVFRQFKKGIEQGSGRELAIRACSQVAGLLS